MRVLFVCSGNICRSPMAAECLRDRAVRGRLSHLVVESAGTLGINGHPAAAEAIAALDEIGLDLRGHRSRGLRESDLRTADLIVCMSHDHLIYLAEAYADFDIDPVLIRAFEEGPVPDPNARDLDDPMGEPIEVYRQQRTILLRCLDHLALRLRHQA